MISKNLSNSSTKTKKSTTGTLKQYHWISIMSFVGIFFCTTLPILMGFLEKLQDTSRNQSIYYLLIENGFLYWVTFFLAFVTAIALFKYLNDKSEVDFFHSLPVLSQYIFLSRYLYGIIYFLLPLLFHGVISYIIAVMGVYRDMPTFSETLLAWTDVFVFYVSVFSFTTFATIITGNTFMAVCASFGFMQAPTALVFVWYGLCDEYLDTFSGNEDLFDTVVQFTNPLFSRLIGNFENATIFNALLQIAVFFAVSFLCFQKRPAENSANPVALEPFKFIIKGLGVVCGGSLGGAIFSITLSSNMFNFLLGSLIVGGILHIAFEMLFDLDVGAGLRNRKHFLFFYGIILITALCISMDVTNYDGRLEPIEKISAITWYDVTLESPENIEIFHNMIATLDTNETNPNNQQTDMNGLVTMHLNNGSSYQRNYKEIYLDNQEYYQLIDSEEFILGTHYYNLTEEYLKNLEESYTINQHLPYYNRSSFSINSTNSFRDLTYDEFRKIYDIVMDQIDEITPDFLRNHYPIISIRCYDHENVSFSLPIYHIHQEALDILDLPNITLRDMTYFTHEDPRDSLDYVSFTEFDRELQETILNEMTLIYDESYYYSYYKSFYHINYAKNLITIKEHGSLRGYLPYDEYDKILEEFNDLKQSESASEGS